MATDEKLETWLAAVERVGAATKALAANIKVYEQGGETIKLAFTQVEASRETLLKANQLEDRAWRKFLEPPAQQSMDGMRPPKPHEQKGPKLLTGRRALPPAAPAVEGDA